MNEHASQEFERNNWLDGLAPLPPYPCVSRDTAVDWLIVGAGFTGISAARRIAISKPDDRILLIDAGDILSGSSSRSSGFLVPIGHFYAPYSAENEKLFRLGSAGLQQLRELVNHHNIQCDWNEAGRLIGARGSTGLRSLNKIRKALAALNSPIETLSGEQVRQQTGLSGYVAAIRQMDSVMVNPAALLHGLIRSLPPNVSIMANSSVSQVAANGNVALANRSQITSTKTLISVNAAANELGIGVHRVFPMRTFVSVVNLPAVNEIESDWGITSSERIGSSIRRVGKHLFIRNTAEFGLASKDPQKELRRISDFQRSTLRSRITDMTGQADLKIQNTWSGSISITANGASLFGQLSDNVLYSTGYNGHGIAHGTISGHAMAERAMGIESEPSALIQTLRKPNWIPSGSALKHGVKSYVKLLRWRYGAEE